MSRRMRRSPRASPACPPRTSPLFTYLGILEMLADADLTRVSAKSIRLSLEEEFKCSLRHRKAELDGIIMTILNAQATVTGEYDGAQGEEYSPHVALRASSEVSSAPSRRGRGAVRKTKSEPKLDDDGNPIKRQTGLTVPMLLSDQLADVIGVVEMSRCDVVKSLWAYIKENQLQDEKDRRYFICDEKLKAVFGRARLSGFEMNKYISGHMQRLERK